MRLLIAAARADTDPPSVDAVDELLNQTTDRILLSLARRHGASGLLFELLHPLAIERGALLERLRKRYVRSAWRHQGAVAELTRLAHDLEDVEDWAVIKGPVVVEEAYGGQGGRRSYHDIDVFVRPRSFGRALMALERAGATVMDCNWLMLRRDLRGEVLLRLSSGTAVDLHWHLINMYRRRTRLDPTEIAERLRPTRIGALTVKTLDPADGLVHLALHAAISGGDRLSWLKDIERATHAWQPDWDVVQERSSRWRIAPAVGLMLDRARVVLNAPVPAELTTEMIGGALSAIAGVVDRRWPWPYTRNRTSSPSRILARSVMHGLAGGAAWVAWRSIRNLDPRQASRSSAFRRRGTERDRERFLDAVAATDPAVSRPSRSGR